MLLVIVRYGIYFVEGKISFYYFSEYEVEGFYLYKYGVCDMFFNCNDYRSIVNCYRI